MKETRYRIIRKLAEGGSGETYLVWDKRLERCWAMKRIPLRQESQRQAVVREMTALRQIRREGIPVLADLFYEEGAVCLVMEYMTGVSLEEKIKRDGAMGEKEAVGCALQAAALVAFLHGLPAGIIHGDLKPLNLMYCEGKISLLDFGGAAFINERAEREECLCYTPGYGAPELRDGRGVSKQTDIYAFGGVLFYLVTGQQPAGCRGICPVREENPFLTAALERIILKCTALDPDDRYGTMEEVLQDLRELGESLSAPGVKEGRPGHDKKEREKRKKDKRKKEKRKQRMFRSIRSILLTEGRGEEKAPPQAGAGRAARKAGIGRATLLLAAGLLSAVTGAGGAMREVGVPVAEAGRRSAARPAEAQAADELLPVCIRNKAGEKLLVDFGAVYHTEENPMFELPLQYFEEGKEYEVTIRQREKTGGTVRERTFVICAD